MSSPIQIGRFDKMLRRLFGVVGRGAIVTTLLEDVFPTMNLMKPAPEFRALGGEFLAMSQATRAAALEMNVVSIINPPGSAVICIIEEIQIFTGGFTAGDLIHVGINQNNFGTANSNAQFRDSRIIGTAGIQQPVCVVNSGSSVAGDIYPSGLKFEVGIEPTIRIDAPDHAVAILQPGFSLGIEAELIALRVRANILWRERAVDPSELVL